MRVSARGSSTVALRFVSQATRRVLRGHSPGEFVAIIDPKISWLTQGLLHSLGVPDLLHERTLRGIRVTSPSNIVLMDSAARFDEDIERVQSDRGLSALLVERGRALRNGIRRSDLILISINVEIPVPPDLVDVLGECACRRRTEASKSCGYGYSSWKAVKQWMWSKQTNRRSTESHPLLKSLARAERRTIGAKGSCNCLHDPWIRQGQERKARKRAGKETNRLYSPHGRHTSRRFPRPQKCS